MQETTTFRLTWSFTYAYFGICMPKTFYPSWERVSLAMGERILGESDFRAREQSPDVDLPPR